MESTGRLRGATGGTWEATPSMRRTLALLNHTHPGGSRHLLLEDLGLAPSSDGERNWVPVTNVEALDAVASSQLRP